MNPPSGIEGDLYRELKRTQPAPQGICVANSSGKVLSWSLTFEDDASVLKFLDHSSARYADHPNASATVAAERFMRFPIHKLPDIADNGKIPKIPDSHAEGELCPGHLPIKKGSLLAKIVGRALDSDGQPISNARTQDNYIEDRFEIPLGAQKEFGAAVAAARGEPFRVPEALSLLLVSNAYLGMLDVNPIGRVYSAAETTAEKINLWAEQSADGSDVSLWGTSSVSGHQDKRGQKTDGRRWNHSVTINWTGKVTLGGEGIQALAILGNGDEKLQWNAGGSRTGGNDVANLPAGRPIDFSGKVRYGIESSSE
jgi:hypothetical protein